MDPFSDVIALLRPHAALSKPITGRGDWGVRYAAYGLPGFAIVLAGRCWLAVDGDEPVRLERGDFVLLPATPAFALFSRPGVACVAGRARRAAGAAWRAGRRTRLPHARRRLPDRPGQRPAAAGAAARMIHIRAAEGDTGRLARIIDLIMDERAADRPGREMILGAAARSDAGRMPALAGRSRDDALPAGLLAGMRDPALARVLRAMHADIRAGWTVAELAKLAGMSRSAFAARFAETLGCAPIEYLSRWRMALAQDALSRGGKPLDRLAEEIGYEFASAFSTAFRRRVGCSPGAFARARREA